MATNQLFLGRFALPSGVTVTPNGSAQTLTAGNYYLYGYTAEATAQLLEHVQALIRLQYASAEVTYSVSTGLVTIDLKASGAVVLSAALAVILGFGTGETAVTDSGTGTLCPLYTWRPSDEPTDYPLELTATDFWIPRSSTATGRGDEGTDWAITGRLTYDGALEYALLPDTDVLPQAARGDFKSFWAYVIHEGQPIRIVLDRTSYISSSFVTGRCSAIGKESIGSFQEFSSRYLKNYNGLWNVKIPLIKNISAS
jgi:hypothetical protein